MKRIMNFIWQMILMTILLLTFSFLIAIIYTDKKRQDSFIGKKVVVEKDTLTIIGNNILGYELSNGLYCDEEYLKQFMIYECE